MMKLMNSDTHSWTVSLASFEIFALAGRDFFMIRLTFAIGRNLSCSFVELSEMLPEVGLPTGLTTAVVAMKLRFWPLMANGGWVWPGRVMEERNSGGGIGGGGGKWVCVGEFKGEEMRN